MDFQKTMPFAKPCFLPPVPFSPVLSHPFTGLIPRWVLFPPLSWLQVNTGISWASQVVVVVKNLPANTGSTRDVSGRSPGEGNDNPLQYSCLGNPMDRGAWWATVHRVSESQTWLSTHTRVSHKPLVTDVHHLVSPCVPFSCVWFSNLWLFFQV